MSFPVLMLLLLLLRSACPRASALTTQHFLDVQQSVTAVLAQAVDNSVPGFDLVRPLRTNLKSKRLAPAGLPLPKPGRRYYLCCLAFASSSIWYRGERNPCHLSHFVSLRGGLATRSR
ncbi:hypothetical protein QBC34DRAFT_42416 [Podospora aff. communis PSN243]|uniref:Uncharacterized protein n=1 Tax=Podospora aff. communis PSN243 TaxID=3040156 RepID=A0AAV9G401_9PEZI|nr:hypothetical protein QBC34DRAFT_42416 [Podospora aff. communis PSN243]